MWKAIHLGQELLTAEQLREGGNKIINVSDDPPVCAVVQKQTKGGYLTVKMVRHNSGLAAILGSENVVDQATTTAAYGIATVCSE